MIIQTLKQVIDWIKKKPAKTKHFELAQGARGTLLEAEHCPVSNRIMKLIEDQASIDQAKFVRLSSESFPELNGAQINFLNDLCLAAHRSEDFYLNAATNQWVRTSIARIAPHEQLPHQLFGSTFPMSSITFQSNVLPCDPFLTKLDQGSKTFHFPCSLLKEAMDRKKPFVHILEEWTEKNEFQLNLVIHGPKSCGQGHPRLFWKIRDADVGIIKVLAGGNDDDNVCVVTWKGGRFVRKKLPTVDTNNHANLGVVLDTELNITDKLSHPNIIYSFGVSHKIERNVSFLFMEHMENDLLALIEDMVRINGSDCPPFSHEHSLNILLQAAKAMAHMHEKNVVHGDLKPKNIFVSKFVMVGDVMQHLVKIADFGSSRTMIEGIDFVAGDHTLNYAAPEVLRRQPGIPLIITNPKAIDVHSFGIIAFEVLTGAELYPGYRPSVLKKAIIGETMTPPMRPPLREECQKHSFLHDNTLLSLIERCWDDEPLNRPPFLDVINVLNSVKDRLQYPVIYDVLFLQEPSSSGSGLHPRQVYFQYLHNIVRDVASLFMSVIRTSCTPTTLLSLAGALIAFVLQQVVASVYMFVMQNSFMPRTLLPLAVLLLTLFVIAFSHSRSGQK